MEMYFGEPQRWHVRGMLGTLRMAAHSKDLWNYFYRGTSAFAVAAAAFGHQTLLDDIVAFAKEFARLSGKDYDD